MTKIIRKTRYLFLILAAFLLLPIGSLTAHAAEIPSIEYTLYNTNREKKAGKDWTAAGDISQSRSEKNDYWNAISMKITNKGSYSGGVRYAIHVHDVGWSHHPKYGVGWYRDGKKLYYDTVNGFTTKYPWIEAISAVLTGELKDYYYINYNTRISPLSQTFRDSPDVAVDEKRYQKGLKFFNGDAKKTNYWVGFDEDLSKVLGDGYNEEGLANDGGLNFAGTWGMAMPISAFRAELKPYQVKVTINPNGGTYNSSTVSAISWQEADTLKNIAAPARRGWKFKGWTMTQTSIKDDKESLKKNKQQYPDNDRTASWKNANKQLQLGNKNITLKANWEKASYTLTIKPNGGTWEGKTGNQSFTLNYAATKHIANPIRPGYTFTGWTLSGTGSALSGKTFKMGSANAILMADWKANSYTIIFDGNGATGGAMEAVQVFYDAEVPLPANLFTKETEQGINTFIGWNRIPDTVEKEFADEEVIRNLTAENGAVIVLYAIWDDCPIIDACDRYFTLKAAQEGSITEEELLNTAAATDREDITLENRTAAQITEGGINGSLSLYGYAADDFTGMTDSGSVSMTYRAVDSIGNTVYEMVTIYVTNTEPIPQTEFQYTRFINEKYYGAPYGAGGLHPRSVWLNHPDYKNALQTALQNLSSNTPVATYRFTKENSLIIRKSGMPWWVEKMGL